MTVVIPFYNDSRTIAAALESLRHQICRPTRILIVDDASNHGEAVNLERICAQFSDLPLRVMHREANEGPSAARNDGWGASTTDYVAFLDADDTWSSRKLRDQLRVLAVDPDIAILGTLATNQDEKSPPPGEPLVRRVRPVEQLLRNRFVTSSILVRSDVSHRFDPTMRYSEDNELWCRILFNGNTGAVLRDELTFYHKPIGSPVGASGNLIKMYYGQIGAYKRLFGSGAIGIGWFSLAVTSASVRLIRRSVIAYYRAVRTYLTRTESKR